MTKETHNSRQVLGRIHRSVLNKLSAFLHWFEVCLAVVCVIFALMGVVYLLGEITHFQALIGEDGLHGALEELLSDILLLAVGIELAIMLVRRTPESLIEVMFFVIARRMLIKTDAFHELLIGVAALAGLFAIRKYLQGRSSSPVSEPEDTDEG